MLSVKIIMIEIPDKSSTPFNEVFKNIYERRSIQSFCPDPVPDDAIMEIIRAGTYAPSAMNIQPWRFVVIKNRQHIKRLSDKAKELWVEMSKNAQKPELQRLADIVSRPGFDMFFNAPLLIMIFAHQEAFMPQIDCAFAAENMMLAARSMGLGSSWVGLAQPLEKVSGIMKDLEVPEKHRLLGSLVFGYPADEGLEAPETERNRSVIMKWID